MAYKVWIHLGFPEGNDRVSEVRDFVKDRDDLEIEGINRFGKTRPDAPKIDPDIIYQGHGVELLYRAPDEKNGPDDLLAMIRRIARAFPEAYIISAMRDFQGEAEELHLEFTTEELNREMVAAGNPTH